ncbi:MAG TPA: hypothetical protein VF066_13170, partial [Thermoleophilaceae bacterium]
DGDDNSGPGSDSSGPGPDGEDRDDDENENEDRCTTADLKAGARVHEAKLVKATNGSAFTKIELVPAA